MFKKLTILLFVFAALTGLALAEPVEETQDDKPLVRWSDIREVAADKAADDAGNQLINDVQIDPNADMSGIAGFGKEYEDQLDDGFLQTGNLLVKRTDILDWYFGGGFISSSELTTEFLYGKVSYRWQVWEKQKSFLLQLGPMLRAEGSLFSTPTYEGKQYTWSLGGEATLVDLPESKSGYGVYTLTGRLSFGQLYPSGQNKKRDANGTRFKQDTSPVTIGEGELVLQIFTPKFLATSYATIATKGGFRKVTNGWLQEWSVSGFYRYPFGGEEEKAYTFYEARLRSYIWMHHYDNSTVGSFRFAPFVQIAYGELGNASDRQTLTSFQGGLQWTFAGGQFGAEIALTYRIRQGVPVKGGGTDSVGEPGVIVTLFGSKF